MATALIWTFHTFPEDPWSGADAAALPTLEEAIVRLQEILTGHSVADLIPAIAAVTQPLEQAPSPMQRFRGWYVVGRAYLRLERWDDALHAFARSALSIDSIQPAATVLLLRSQALAAHQLHHYTEAIGYYRQLIERWQRIPPDEQARILEEDAQSFLCNTIRQLAQAWLFLGAPETACAILENQALPLIDARWRQLPTPHEHGAATASESNWRLIWLFTIWLHGQSMIWQARCASNPLLRVPELHNAYERVHDAARLSQTMPEGVSWSANLLTTAAEMLIHGSQLTSMPQLRTFMCMKAAEHLAEARLVTTAGATSKMDTLRALVLQLPEYELQLAEVRANLVPHAANALLEHVVALRDAALADADPSYQLFTARCAWLMGQIETAFAHDDGKAIGRAKAHFLNALRLLTGKSEYSSLIECGVRTDLARLEKSSQSS